MILNKKIYSKGFTLAEVLVVIAVLGVIAALTIPSLLYGYDEKQLNTRWKKEYNVAVNAVKRIYANKGYIDFSTNAAMRNDFKTVMNFMSEAPWNQLSDNSYDYYKNSSASKDTSGWTEESALMLDSSIWKFVSYTNDCTGVSNTLTNICGDITIDVNAKNPPNEYGKDLYFIHIIRVEGDYQVYPFGADGDGETCVNPSASETTSRGCSREALINLPANMP